MELYSGLIELLRGQKILSETQMLRVNFWIAIILLHKLAHAVRQYLSSSLYEPFHGDQVLAEVGHAWTCWVFGGVIERFRLPRCEDPDEIGGFWMTTSSTPWTRFPRSAEFWPANLPQPPVLGNLPQRATMWLLATEYVQRVQTEEFWEEDIRVHGVRALHIAPANDDSQLSSNLDWRAKENMRRGPNGKMETEGLHSNPSAKKDN